MEIRKIMWLGLHYVQSFIWLEGPEAFHSWNNCGGYWIRHPNRERMVLGSEKNLFHIGKEKRQGVNAAPFIHKIDDWNKSFLVTFSRNVLTILLWAFIAFQYLYWDQVTTLCDPHHARPDVFVACVRIVRASRAKRPVCDLICNVEFIVRVFLRRFKR